MTHSPSTIQQVIDSKNANEFINTFETVFANKENVFTPENVTQIKDKAFEVAGQAASIGGGEAWDINARAAGQAAQKIAAKLNGVLIAATAMGIDNALNLAKNDLLNATCVPMVRC